MKLFAFFCGLIAANPMTHLLLHKALDEDGESNDNLLMMMVMSPGLLGGNNDQANQMESLLPLMLLDESGDDNTMMLMMTMMQNPNTPPSARDTPFRAEPEKYK